MHLPTKNDIEEAYKNLDGIIYRTPLVPFWGPSDNPQIYLKLENMQRFGSFKLRAAANAIKSIKPDLLADGIVTASAGNFGQGLCSAAQLLDIKCTVCVPKTAAETKVQAMANLGANIIKMPFDKWWDILRTRETGQAGHFIHPVCEQSVMNGNATIGAEILEDLPDVNIVAVPVGGGGLASGIGAAMKASSKEIQVIASESETSMPVAAALKNGKPTDVAHQISFIDGMGGKSVLPDIWPLLKTVMDGAVASSHEEIAEAIRHLAQYHHNIAEGAGAASLAAALHHLPQNKKIVCVISGGNIDTSTLTTILSGRMP